VSAVIAQLAGINIISGVGALDFVNTFSLEKLIIDHEVCGTVLRLHRGIDCSPESLAVDLINELGPGGNYLEAEHTLKWFKKEPFTPSAVFDRRDRSGWDAEGRKDTFERAREKVQEIQQNHVPPELDSDRAAKLDVVTAAIMKELGIEEALPQGPK